MPITIFMPGILYLYKLANDVLLDHSILILIHK